MPLRIIRDDITLVDADAIVNAANERLLAGGGVCGAIFRAAGASRLQAACDKIGHCDTGSAVATPAFNLPAKYVIHAVGPVWEGGSHGERALLSGCYLSSLQLAAELGCASIAFPLISSGIYGYPKREALNVATIAIGDFLATDDGADMDVSLVLFDADAVSVAGERYDDIAAYIDDVYVDESQWERRAGWEEMRPFDAGGAPVGRAYPGLRLGAATAAAPDAAAAPDLLAERSASSAEGASLEDWLSNMEASFSETLLSMIDDRGLKDATVYRRANLSRQHFSKIRSNPDYRPSKPTVLALAVALGLGVDETRLLLSRAGFALSHADKRDVIVEYFLMRGKYDIHEINRTLYAFDQPLLG